MLSFVLLLMVACSDVDATETTNMDATGFAEEFIKIVKKGQFLTAIGYYEGKSDGLPEEQVEELRESMVVELDKYLEDLDEEAEGDHNKSNRMLAAVEFIKKIGFQDEINGDINDYKKRADETIEKLLDAEEEKEKERLAKIEKEKEKEQELKKKEEEEAEQAKKEEEKLEQVKKEEEKIEKEKKPKKKKATKKTAKKNEQKKETKKENTETNSQQQAVAMARNYIDYTAFAKSGLIEQLKFEGFSGEDAAYAVESIDVNWKEQAVKMAQNYLDYTAFSRDGLIDQLIFEGFSSEVATYAVNQVGL